jgi:hypothetical protein
MTRTEQIALAVKAICLDTGKVGVMVEDERFDIEVAETERGPDHVWDSVKINGSSCGNRHGGVRYLMIALGETEAQDEFADREAIAYRAERVEAQKSTRYTSADVGCHADGAQGHQHVREILGALLGTSLSPEELTLAEPLVESLRGEMPDDCWDEHEALETLNQVCCDDSCHFMLSQGDLLLVPAGDGVTIEEV